MSSAAPAKPMAPVTRITQSFLRPYGRATSITTALPRPVASSPEAGPSFGESGAASSKEIVDGADAPRCVTCGRGFAFRLGEAAVVLRHVAYGYDFAHEGRCVDAARETLFAEPGYDCAALGRDAERGRVLAVASAAGWSAVLAAPEGHLPWRGRGPRVEPLRCWALVEYRDGRRRIEGLTRNDEWLDEPGGAEFPEASRGGVGWLGYASAEDAADPMRMAAWTARARMRQGNPLPPIRFDLPTALAA